MKSVLVSFLFMTGVNLSNGFFPALFQLERSIKCVARNPNPDVHYDKLNELCRELDKYEKMGVVKLYKSDMDGNWSIINSRESRLCFSYQSMDLTNKKASEVHNYYNGTTIERKYNIDVHKDFKHITFQKYKEIFNNKNNTIVNGVHGDPFENELVYISPVLRVERNSDGELVVFEPTPVRLNALNL